MSDHEALLAAIAAEEERIVAFFQDFVRCRSPNPPGNTVEAVRFITDFLASENAPWRLVAPQETMPNVVGTIETGRSWASSGPQRSCRRVSGGGRPGSRGLDLRPLGRGDP